MTTNRMSPAPASRSKSLFGLLLALLLPLSSVFAQITLPTDSQTVTYNPNNIIGVQGDEPLHYQYVLTVFAPTVITGPTTINLVASVVNNPGSLPAATAAGFVTFSTSQITFSGPGAQVQVVVHLDVPLDAGAAVGDFTYKINTTGWNPALGIIDNGTFINMHVSPPTGLNPPTVAITSPADGTSYLYNTGGPAVQVPITVIGVANDSAPVLTLTADVFGFDADGVPIPDQVLVLTYVGLGSPSASGTVTLPVSVPGTYTIDAQASNSQGVSVTSSEFIVNEVIAPPVATVNPPAGETHTYVRGLTSAAVPFTFTGKSNKGGVQSLTATLDGNPLSPDALSGIGTLLATGTGTLNFDASTVNGVGQHTITATVTDAYGTGTASANFTVAEQVPTINCNIATPGDGVTIPLPPDGSALNIPFSFTSAATFGAPVTALAATITSDAGTVSVPLASTTGLCSGSATGTGTLTNVLPGTYTLGATGTNAALSLSAFDSASFVVTAPPPPAISYTQSPSATYTGLTGYPVNIPFAFQTTSTGAYIKTQRATLDGVAVTLTTNTAAGTALIATGSGTVSVPSPTSGTSTHTLVVYGTDVYNGVYSSEVSAVVTFSVTVTDPVITVAINPEVAGSSPYTMPASGSLAIPFKFTGNITAGATVDTITGTLNGNAVTIGSYSGLGTAATATGTGTLTITQAGTYTLAANDSNTASGLTANTSVTFVVNPATVKPPLSVSITQAPSASYTLINGTGSLSIPITFVGKSNNGNWGGSVSTMSATLDGAAVTLSSTSGLNSPTATSTATLSVKTAGTHVLVVKDTDPYNQVATASTTFTVTLQNPVISIVVNNPTNNSSFTLPCGGCGSSLSVPFSYTANITSPATIDILSATLNGCAVSVTTSGIGTSSATGTGTVKVTSAGTYTLTFKATDTSPSNAGSCGGSTGVSATASVTFTVKKAGPPTVAITSPTQSSFTAYCLSCGGLSVPFAATATSQCGGISKITATLDGTCLNVTSAGIGSLTATASGTMAVKCTGTHKLTVTASDPNGTTSQSFTFTVVSATPAPAVAISQPTNGATFTYNYNAAAPSIPFSFTATTNAGATISSVKASLGCSTLNVTTTGVGTNSATGTGTISISGPGTYTLSVTAVSCGVNVSSKVSFTVVQNAPPKCTVGWYGSVCGGYPLAGGSPTNCQFQVKCTTYNGNCTPQRDTTVKVSYYEIYSNGSCSSAKVYSSSNYSIDGNCIYNLSLATSGGTHRYHVDVYYFPNGGTTPCAIGSKEFSTR